eukprot:11962088-Alexandrium_andersonii.AAC.1
MVLCWCRGASSLVGAPRCGCQVSRGRASSACACWAGHLQRRGLLYIVVGRLRAAFAARDC